MLITVPNLVTTHGVQASVDRAHLAELTANQPSALVNFQLFLTSAEPFEEVQRRGHDLKAVVAALPSASGGTGGTESLVSPIKLIKTADAVILSFDLSPNVLSTTFPNSGLYLVGLVPQVEITAANNLGQDLTRLVNSNSPSWRMMNSAALQITPVAAVNTVPGTYTRIPSAPGLTNHLTFTVSATAASLGIELTEALPLLRCALLSSVTDGPVSVSAHYSDRTMVLEPWSEASRPSELKLKFVWENSKDILREGQYCVVLVYNEWLTEVACPGGAMYVEVFHLPSSLYSYPDSGCDVATEVADYLYF